MIKTVALEMKWLPNKIGSLFIDDMDYKGLIYWDSEIRSQIDKMKPKKEKK